MRVRHDDGVFVIEEHSGPLVDEYRFALDRRVKSGKRTIRENVGWYRTLRGAFGALTRAGGSLSETPPRQTSSRDGSAGSGSGIG